MITRLLMAIKFFMVNYAIDLVIILLSIVKYLVKLFCDMKI